MSYFNYRGLDVIGTQEYQETQFDYAQAKGYGGTWGSYYWDPEGKRRDTENAIIWRKSTMEFVSGSTYDIPYFGGNTRHVPIVLLRQKLMISPNSIPSNTCAYPRESSIDWIFAAGQARFSNFKRDKATQTGRISDHPLVYSEAHLQY
jgi:hypothetical protein